jgi:hypothetical protein
MEGDDERLVLGEEFAEMTTFTGPH